MSGKRDHSDVHVLILAGSRAGETDPLYTEYGYAQKADLPINGRPMLDYVTDALAAAKFKKPYFISGYGGDKRPLKSVPAASDPASSILAAVDAGAPLPLLVTTSDHPLLSKDILLSFMQGAHASDADICAGLASRATIEADYPETRRTYLKFKDIDVSGCNLFYIARPEGLKAIEFWQTAQHLRKHPIRLAFRIGLSVLIRYISGRLTLDGFFDYGSKKIGTKIRPVLLPYAEAAIDVDKPSDKVLVEQILTRKRHDRSQT